MTHDLDHEVIPHELWSYTHMQKFKVNSQSVPKIEWKQTDGRTDGGDCITCRVHAVGKNRVRKAFEMSKFLLRN